MNDQKGREMYCQRQPGVRTACSRALVSENDKVFRREVILRAVARALQSSRRPNRLQKQMRVTRGRRDHLVSGGQQGVGQFYK